MPPEMVKIIFELDPEGWHGGGAETLWAERVPEMGEFAFKLRNSPFCATGVSLDDVVRGSPTEAPTHFDFVEVLRRGGHSTFMLLMRPDDPRIESYWLPLERAGCTYESGTEQRRDGPLMFYSVDVPPTTDLIQVYTMLERGVTDGVWHVEDGHVVTTG